MPPTASYDLLVSALRDAGHTVDEVGPTQGSMFSGDGHIIKLDGQEVQIFQYPTPADTEAEAARISSDGGQFTGANGVVASVDWMDVPHFFKNGLVMVVYVGRDTATTGALEAVLGPQFAGG